MNKFWLMPIMFLLVSCASINKKDMEDLNTLSLHFKNKINNYVASYGNENYDIKNLIFTDLKKFSLFGKSGFLLCFHDARGENIFYYPGPYGMIYDLETDSEDNLYDSGGGSYLCKLTSIKDEGNEEYSIVTKSPAIFPETENKYGLQGSVTVEYTINETGRVEDVHIYKPGPTEAFNKAAVESVNQYVYKPRKINHVARKVFGVKARIRFSYDESPISHNTLSPNLVKKLENRKRGVEKIISNDLLNYYQEGYAQQKQNKAIAQSDAGSFSVIVSAKIKEGAMYAAIAKCQKKNQQYEEDFPCKVINVNDMWVD